MWHTERKRKSDELTKKAQAEAAALDAKAKAAEKGKGGEELPPQKGGAGKEAELPPSRAPGKEKEAPPPPKGGGRKTEEAPPKAQGKDGESKQAPEKKITVAPVVVAPTPFEAACEQLLPLMYSDGFMDYTARSYALSLWQTAELLNGEFVRPSFVFRGRPEPHPHVDEIAFQKWQAFAQARSRLELQVLRSALLSPCMLTFCGFALCFV